MPYCSECGREIQRGVKFCPECGAPQGATNTAPVVDSHTRKSGPSGSGPLKTVAILEVSIGVVFLILGILSLLYAADSPTTVALPVVIFLATGSITAVSGFGIFRRTSWSRRAGVVGGVALVAVGLLLMATLGAFLGALGALCIALGISLLVLLRSTRFRAYLA